MKAGIIAAGTGERLARAGIAVPKALIRIGGEPLIARTIRAAASIQAKFVACIINELTPDLDHYLRSTTWPLPVHVVKRTTPSSMESLFSLAPLLADEPFMLFTVDAVFPLAGLKRFLGKALAVSDAQAVLALTRFVDDEKPLWVQTTTHRRVRAMGDAARATPYVTAGFYYFQPDVFNLVELARARALGALRQFLGLMVDNGYRLYGVPVPKTIDVDYPQDIERADRYIRKIERGTPNEAAGRVPGKEVLSRKGP
jgi:NDP-sugar pyrophosphorylase family protein